MSYRHVVLVVMFALALSGQTVRPEFEVASVKPVPPAVDGHISTRMSSDDGIVRYTNVTLKDIIAQAYGIAKYQIAGPGWLDTERYAVAARIPAGASEKQVPAMLQALLADRFAMVVHRESKDMAVLALVVAKGGSKLNAVQTDATGCDGSSNSRRYSLSCHTTLPTFAQQLSRNTDLPVVDKTLLEGTFEISLQWIPDGAAPDDSGAGATLLEALPEQLGLRLEAQHAPVGILVVDSANRIPTEN